MPDSKSKETVNAVYCLLDECPNKNLKCLVTHGANSKEEFSKILIDLCILNTRLHHAPKFFVKLLLALTECVQEETAGKLIRKGKLPVRVSVHLVSVFRQLPYGQTIELWKIFAETYTIFVNMGQILPHGRGAVFVLAQLFSSFLLHSCLFDPVTPMSIVAKFEDLINYTEKELKENISILSDTKVPLLQKSHLILYFSLGEVKLSFHNCFERTVFNNPLFLQVPSDVFNFSLVHNALAEYSEPLKSLLGTSDKASCYLIFELLLQKVKGIISISKEHNEEELSHLNECLNFLLLHAKENSLFETQWDLDISSLNESNYGHAVWRILLKYFPLLIDFVDCGTLLSFCDTFQTVMLQSISNSLESIDEESLSMLSTLKNEFMEESKTFQTCLASTIWKLDNMLVHKKRSSDEIVSENNLVQVLNSLSTFRPKWLKYIKTTPKDKEDSGLNSMWSSIQNTCNIFNNLLQEDGTKRTKVDPKIYNIIKIISCFPLEHLLPVNQVRVLVGLSSLFFLIPDNVSSNESLKIAEEISMLLVSIFDGVRSIWLFDFVKNGPYIKQIAITITRIIDSNSSFDVIKWPKLLLKHIIGLCVRNTDAISSLESSFSQIIIEDNPCQSSVLALGLILEKLSQISQRQRLYPDFKEICKRIFSLACSACIKLLNRYEKNNSDNLFTLVISCYSEAIHVLCAGTLQTEKKLTENCLKPLAKVISIIQNNLTFDINKQEKAGIYLKFFTCICKHHERLSNFIPEDFITIIWRSIQLHHQKSPSHLLAIPNSIFQDINFQENEVELLQELFSALSHKELDCIFLEILKKMESSHVSLSHCADLQVNLCVLKELLETMSKIPKSEFKLPDERFLRLRSHLYHVISQTEDTEESVHHIKIPILHFINFFIKLHKGCVPKQCLIQCFYFCTTINLNKINDLKLFTASFNAVWKIAYNLLVEQTVALSVSAVFISTVTMLLKCLVNSGSQGKVLACNQETRQNILMCAQNMERLLTIISRYTKNFEKLAPYIIADYVDCVQHITLESNIKRHLMTGLNRLLDLCSEDALKMLAVNISRNCRDIYSNIVKDYKQFRFSGAV